MQQTVATPMMTTMANEVAFPDVPADDAPLVGAQPCKGVVPAFDELQFWLNVETTELPTSVPNLVNRVESADSRVDAVSIGEVCIFLEDGDDVELDSSLMARKIAFFGTKLVLHNDDPTRPLQRCFAVPRGYLTIAELLDHIVAFETDARPLTDWCGGVDAHHTMYEGMVRRKEDGAYSIMWGS